MSDEYNLLVKCKNCKNQQWVKDISAGARVEEHCAEKDLRCTYCRCTLYKDKEESGD